MKSLKILLGLSMPILGAGAVAFGVAASNKQNLKVATAEVSTGSRRIWILNNDNWWTDNNYFVEASNGVDSVSTSKVTMVLNDYYCGFGYVDLTISNATSALTVRVIENIGSPAHGDYKQTVELTLPALGGEDTIWMNSGGTWDGTHSWNDRNASLGTTNGFSGDQLAVVLSNYDTCSNAVTNGYNAFPQLKTNFFDKTDSGAFDTKVYGQDVYTCRDYADGMSSRYEANK